MAAVWLRLRSELRARWRAMLGLAVLLGIMAGAATAAAAGARRTETAYPRFLERYRTSDVEFTTGGSEFSEQIFQAAKRIPGVVATFRTSVYPAAVRTSDGQTLEFPGVFVLGDHARLPEYPPGKLIAGRMSDPERADEAMVNYAMAERLGIEPGDVVEVTLPGADEDAPEPLVSQHLSVTITGISARAGHFEQVNGLGFVRVFHMTPAFQRAWGAYSFQDDNFGVRLRDGLSGVDNFLYALRSEMSSIGVAEPFDTPPTTTRVEVPGVQGLNRVPVVALWLMCGFVVVTTLAVFTQLLAREIRLGGRDHGPLSALGMARAELFAISAIRSFVIAATGAVISVGVAFALSPLTPVGLARIAEPDPGLSFAPWVFLAGAAATTVVVTAAGAVVAWASSRRTRRSPAEAGPYPSRTLAALGRFPLALSARSGLSMAVDSGRGDRAIPVRTAVLGTTIAGAALITAVTFGTSLANLIGDPRLAGYTWDAGVIAAAFNGSPSSYVARMETAVAKRFPNATLSRGTVFAAVVVDGQEVGAQVSDGPAPSIIEGRAPAARNEVALDPRTLARLHKGVGDTVDVAPSATETAYTLKVVGSFAPPRIVFQGANPGQSAALTPQGFRQLSPQGDYAEALYVDFADDRDLIASVSALREATATDAFAVLSREESSTVGNVERLSALPTMLAALTGLLGMATLAHALTTTIRRRGRDLAVLKTIGLVGGQVRGIVAWQSTALVGASLIVGLPLGVVAGRWGWRLFAQELQVVPVPVVSPLLVAAVAAGAILAGNLIAAFPAHWAARTSPALVLRTE